MLNRERLPTDRRGFTKKFEIYGSTSTLDGYVTVNFYPDGRVGEFFLVISKEGSTVSGFADLWAQQCSRLFQAGYTVAEFIDHNEDVRFEPAGPTNDPEIPEAKSLADYLAKYLKKIHVKFMAGVEAAEASNSRAS